MFINENFVFDDIDAYETFGIEVIQVDSSNMLEMTFGVNRSIVEEKVSLNSAPFFYGVDEEPLSITIKIMKADEGYWDSEDRRKIITWLFQKQYKPLISMDNPDIAYYCIAIGDPRRFDTSMEQGYAEIQFRTNAPYGFSYPQNIIDFDLTENQSTTLITLENNSNIVDYYYPELFIEVVDGTDISIKNLTVQGEEFKFTGLQKDEQLYINNTKKFIESSLGKTVYRYKNFNKKWLRLIRGENTLEITGKCNLQFRIQYPIAL